MKWDGQFLQSPTGQLLAVGMLAILAAGAVAWQRAHRKAEPMPEPKVSSAAALPRVFQRAGARFEPPVAIPPPAPTVTSQASNPAPSLPKILPLGVVATRTLPEDGAPVAFAPFGRMVPCETVVVLESNRLETPVVGLVTEDIWEGGRLVIPAGAEVHGRASLDRTRERIAVEGTWTVVWRPRQGERAIQVRVTGIALDRAPDLGKETVGQHDGSAGLRGEVLRTDDLREVKLFAATFLSTATSALQDTRASVGLLGEVSVPATTVRNATLAGTSAILREYAQHLRDAITRDGFYVRVPAGKPFYLYVTQEFGGGRSPTAAPHSPSKPASP